MCIQCMATATTTLGVVGGIRAWLAASRPVWLTPRRMRIATVALLTVGVLASGVRPA
jgi:hypothetical protein